MIKRNTNSKLTLEERVTRLEKFIKEDAELSHLIEATHNAVNDLIDMISNHEKQSKFLDMMIHKEDKAINTIIDFIANHYYYDFSRGYLLSKRSVIAEEASEVASDLAIYFDWEDKGYFDGDGDFDESLNCTRKPVKNEAAFADVLELDDDEYSKLAAMLSSMVPAKMRKALRMGADPDMSSVKYNHGNGCTALRTAAIMGEYEPARILIEAGADVNAKDPVGKTPLDYATAGGFDDIVELLLDNGGKSDRDVRRRSRS